MPTYQYSCTECGHFFEQVQGFSDASLTECPACQGKLRKVFNAVGVVFKGSGFYRTDSRSENGAKTTAGAGAASASKDGVTSNGTKDSGSKDSGGTKDTGSGGTPSSGSASTGSSGGSSTSSSGTSKSGSAA